MLKDTILKFLKLDGFVQILSGYLETRVELFKLELREDLARSLAKMTVFFVLTFSILLFFLFISVALAFLIGESLGLVLGFTTVAFIYLFLTLILSLLREPIGKSLEKKLMEIVKKK